MPLYVNDWLSSPRVQCMTPAQELAYFRLLAFCWASQDASLPDDDQRLSVMSRMGEGWFNGGSHLVRECFKQHPTKHGYLTNERVYELWSERQKWREKSRRGGIKSGVARRSDDKKCLKGGSRVVEPNGNSSSSSSSSSSSKERAKALSVRTQVEADFDAWYAAYPRKTGKDRARTAFKKARAKVLARDPPCNTMAWLLAVTAAFHDSPSGKAAGRFCPYPASWLNGGQYDDDPESWERPDPKEKPLAVTKADLGIEDDDDAE